MVFFQGSGGPVTAAEFIPAQRPDLRDALATLADRLAREQHLDGPMIHPRGSGRWSVWLEDDEGGRHNFLIHLSGLQRADDPPLPPPREARIKFGVRIPSRADHRPGETETVDASAYISKNFSGPARSQLLEALHRAERGLPGPEGTVERTDDGVVLRAILDEAGRHVFQAEVRLKRLGIE